jgi:predicted unusual protein kinase regulating ubiquinone biosynthesis (AarF/ABC1/UbiB family)
MAEKTPRRRSAVPATRIERLLRFGMLSGELALTTALAGARQLAGGRRPDLLSSVLTPANADLLARRLATLRGPAMKVGQMLSLQGDDILPAEFRNALDMLRSQAYAMPETQLKRVLGREYGKGWESRFKQFSLEPVAAASIGQVHRVTRAGGRELALKIQYPGVAKSVDSDVDNLATLLRGFNFLPVPLDVPAIVAEAKRQLRLETDYENEARNLERYNRLVSGIPGVLVPRVDRSLSTRRILALDWMEGEPLETLSSEAVPQATRNAVGRTLQLLMFRELFDFRFMQSDPNFANYLYRPATQELVLLDLGAVCEFSAEFVDRYRRICRSLLEGNEGGVRDAAFEIGYAHPGDPEERTRAAVEIIRLVCEPLVHRGPYDFAGSRLVARARDLGMAVAFREGLRSPPAETIFLHRKLVGTFLICARMQARVNVHALIERFV